MPRPLGIWRSRGYSEAPSRPEVEGFARVVVVVISRLVMDILVVATELSPYVRESSAADSISELSRGLVNLGHELTVVLPRYPEFEAEGLLVARRLTPLKVAAVEGTQSVTVFDGQLSSGIKLVLLDGSGLGSLGTDEEDSKETVDEATRLGTFCQAVAALVSQRAAQGQAFDAVHVHGAALGPLAALKAQGAKENYVLTLHAVESRLLSARDFKHWGLSAELMNAAKVGTRFSPLKAGLQAADWVAAGSTAFARALTSEAVGGALAEDFAALGNKLLGVPDGIDYGTFNPATDTALPLRFDATDPSGKRSCKSALLRRFELDFDPERPLVVMSGELSKDTGAHVLAEALPELVRQPLSLVVLGAGAKGLVKTLAAARWQQLDNYKFIEAPESRIVRHALAAADFALFLQQNDSSARDVKIAQRYGAVPVALDAGAYPDVIVNCDPRLESGTGLLIDELSGPSLLGGVTRALAAQRESGFSSLVRRVMRLDSSWERPARRYVQLYRTKPGATPQ